MILTEYFLAISIAKLVFPEAVGPIKKITSLFDSITIGIVGIYLAVEGATRRYVAIFSFVEKEGMVGSPERTRQLYGRVLPIHLERAGHRDDALID